MIHRMLSSLSQWELSTLGEGDMNLKGTKIFKKSDFFFEIMKTHGIEVIKAIVSK